MSEHEIAIGCGAESCVIAGSGGRVVAPPTLDDMLPKVWPPRFWTQVQCPPIERLGGRMYRWGKLSVAVSLEKHPVGLWLHTSVSKSEGRVLPSWDELATVKMAVHEDRLCVQVLPPKSEYVNLAEVLHLWERLDEPTLPDDLARGRL